MVVVTMTVVVMAAVSGYSFYVLTACVVVAGTGDPSVSDRDRGIELTLIPGHVPDRLVHPVLFTPRKSVAAVLTVPRHHNTTFFFRRPEPQCRSCFCRSVGLVS